MTPYIHSRPLKRLAATALTAFAALTLNAKEPAPNFSAKGPGPAVQDPILEPAVSSLNGKVDAHYGRIFDTYSRGISGSVSIPVGVRYGAQIDGLYAHANEDDFYGLGGHFFARKPSEGLIGIVASGIYSGAVESYLAAVEGELYLDMVTLGAVAGYNNVQTDVLFPTFNPDLATEDDFFFAHVYASIYPIEDLMVRFEYRNIVERNIYGVTVEYQLPVPGLALYGSFALGDNNYRHALGGLRYYFGGNKSLKSRHRQDDPPNSLDNALQVGVATASNPGSPASVGKPQQNF